MNGQWIGTYVGTNSGSITLELDERRNNFVGWAYLYDSAQGFPSSAARVVTADKAEKQSFKVEVAPLNSFNGSILNHDEFNSAYPDFSFPDSAEVEFDVSSGDLRIAWKTNINTFGTATLPKSKASLPSELVPKRLTTWNDFKQEVSELPMRDHIFRGHSKSGLWRLRTSFHRSGRADLRAYAYNDIRQLHASTINLTDHRFALENPLDLAAFYALLQHHGYPTPMQDWTYSPYVAAYFAFASISKNPKDQSGDCRIFSLESRRFNNEIKQMKNVEGVQPHFSLIEPLAIGNQRMSSQHGFFALSNVDDIESHIRMLECSRNTTYLRAIDLPASLRAEVMIDLERMGITAASLFPGIDGVCQFQKERLF